MILNKLVNKSPDNFPSYEKYNKKCFLFLGLMQKSQHLQRVRELTTFAWSFYRGPKQFKKFLDCLNCFGLEQKCLLKAESCLQTHFQNTKKVYIGRYFCKRVYYHRFLCFLCKTVSTGSRLFWTYKRTRHISTSLPNF